MKRLLVLAALAAVGFMLLYGVSVMPPMGSRNAPDKTHVSPRYLLEGEREAGAGNIVTGVILNYRAYDTMGEVAVIFSALCAVIAILDREKRGRSRSGVDASGVETSVIVRTVVRFSVPVVLLFAAYMILHGKPTPGGGFQGGAVIGASVVLFTLAFGLAVSTNRMPLNSRVPLESLNMLGFLAVGFIGVGLGAQFLAYALPGVHGTAVETVRSLMMEAIETGIGIGGGVIFIGIVFSMIREDRYELEQALP